MASAPAPQFDINDASSSGIDQPIEGVPPVAGAETALAPEPEPATESGSEAAVPVPPMEYVSVIRLTRTWVQYGIFGFAVLCIVIGAMEALFGR